MKKSDIILLLIALSAILSAIVYKAFWSDKETAQKPGAAVQTPIPVQSTFVPQASTPEPVSSETVKFLRKDAEAAISECSEVYAGLDKGEASNVVLSDTSVSQLVNALAASGYSVVDYFGGCDMKNPEALVNFGQAANLGNNAQASYFVVRNDGGIDAFTLMLQNGTATESVFSFEWDEDNMPHLYASGNYTLSEMRYTQKGWLILRRASKNNDAPYTMLRLSEYSAEKRGLAQKYLGTSPYSENNLFTCTWETGSYKDLDFNCLYPIFYGMYYGTNPLIFSNITELTGYSSVPGTGLHVVPYDDFERVIQHYIDVDASYLRQFAQTSSKYSGYYILGAQDRYYGSGASSSVPTAEVTDFWRNNDGTLSLQVDAISRENGTDCAFTHIVTIKETKNGFRYYSNKLVENPENILPSQVLRQERLNQVSELRAANK